MIGETKIKMDELKSVVKTAYNKYKGETPERVKIIDIFAVFLGLMGK